MIMADKVLTIVVGRPGILRLAKLILGLSGSAKSPDRDPYVIFLIVAISYT